MSCISLDTMWLVAIVFYEASLTHAQRIILNEQLEIVSFVSYIVLKVSLRECFHTSKRGSCECYKMCQFTVELLFKS